MAEPSAFSDEIYASLRACLDLDFPKVCQSCGRSYQNLEKFIAQTNRMTDHSGLMNYLDPDHHRTLVCLYRNCQCRNTLMVVCEDRRDTSSSGIKQRERFHDLLVLLEQKELGHEDARKALLGMLNGEKNELLEEFGLNAQDFFSTTQGAD